MADITITIQTGQTSVVRTIPDAKVAEFKAGFLRMRPNISGGDDLAWLMQFVAGKIFAEYKSGKHWLARDAENIVVENILV